MRFLRLALAGLVGLIVVVVVAVLLFASSTNPPSPGAFYAPPSPLPSGPPGTVIRSEPVPHPPEGAREWKILYLSKSYSGKPAAVSGLIFVPTAPVHGGGRLIVASTHGTIGVASYCAGSNQGPKYWPAIDGLKEFLHAGYVVVAPDYQGLGTAGPHPYLVGRSEAWAALDEVRAAHMFAAAHAGRRFAVFGASQGGQAALFTGQEAASYAPELRLVGVAAAAPATDLKRLFETNRDSTFGRVLSAYTIDTWSRVYPELHVDQLVAPLARPVVKRIAKTCIALDTKATIAAAIVSEALRISYLHTLPWETEPWKSLIAENSPGHATMPAPVLITQGDADKLIRPPITQAFVKLLCARGEIVSYRTFPRVDHLHAAIETAPQVANWIAERFAGKPALSTCKP